VVTSIKITKVAFLSDFFFFENVCFCTLKLLGNQIFPIVLTFDGIPKKPGKK